MAIFEQPISLEQAHSGRSLPVFFVLVFAFAIPFWVIGSCGVSI